MAYPQVFTPDELRSNAPALYAEVRPVRFQEVDAAGVIFYPRMLEYFSDTYQGWLATLGYALPSRVADGSFLTPIVHAEADYLAPLRFGDTVTVELAEARVRDRSFTLGFRVRRQDGMIAATGYVVYVRIDLPTGKSIRLPEDFRDALLAAGAQHL